MTTIPHTAGLIARLFQFCQTHKLAIGSVTAEMPDLLADLKVSHQERTIRLELSAGLSLFHAEGIKAELAPCHLVISSPTNNAHFSTILDVLNGKEVRFGKTTLQFPDGSALPQIRYLMAEDKIRLRWNKPGRVSQGGPVADLIAVHIFRTHCRLEIEKTVLGFDLAEDPVFKFGE